VELHPEETLELTVRDGSVRKITLLETGAKVTRTTIRTPKVEEKAGRTDYRFWANLLVDGQPFTLEREVSTQKSFYEPWQIAGLHVWLDAVDEIFEFLSETHGECRPRRKARLAFQDAAASICPEKLHPWCPLPEGGLRIEDCYRGEDCWLGAYNGASAHGGLDINHPKGTPLWAPLDFDDQFYFNSVEMGHNNNRWRGLHRWPDGSEWILQAHHMVKLTVPEHTPLRKGQLFAEAAGVWCGAAEHSHFVFKVHDEGETILLDPWILFRQMYLDHGRG